jgi:hypothetical protein
MVHQHQIVGDAHLVGMPTLRNLDHGKLARRARIRHIDDGGAARGALMPHIHDGPIDPNLATARTVEMRHQRGVGARRQWLLVEILKAGCGIGWICL